MWGPLAAASVCQLLWVVVRLLASEGVKVPGLADILRSFALPATAEAVGADEKSEAARRMLDSVVALGNRTGAAVKMETRENGKG